MTADSPSECPGYLDFSKLPKTDTISQKGKLNQKKKEHSKTKQTKKHVNDNEM